MVFINTELKATYIHNVKCGGCFTREILLNYYNFKDVQRTDRHHNYESFFDDKKFINFSENNDAHTIRKYGKYRFFTSYQHYKKEYFEDYFIFCFVRNPYDKLFSAYNYLLNKLKQSDFKFVRESKENKDYFIDFTTFIKNYNNVNNISYFHAFIPQYEHLINNNNTINISFIGYYEDFDNELLNALTLMGIKKILYSEQIYFENKINIFKVTTLEKKNQYSEYAFNFVNEYFKKDFEIFNYKMYDSYEDFLNNHFNENNPPINSFYKNYQLLLCENELNKKELVNNKNKIKELLKVIYNCLNNYIITNKIKTINDSYEIKIFDKYSNINKISNDLFYNMHYNSIIKYIKICNKCNYKCMNELSFHAHKYFCK